MTTFDDRDPLRGQCSICGKYLSRKTVDYPILNPDGTRHKHPSPWFLVDRKRRKPEGELAAALDAYSSDPCAACGQALGTHWMERLRADGSRLEKVHLECPTP